MPDDPIALRFEEPSGSGPIRDPEMQLAPAGIVVVAGAFPLEEELRVLADTARGLHYAHELRDFTGAPLNVVHRDVSPQNIFLTYDGQVKLLDFGIAKAVDSEHLTQVGLIKGKRIGWPRGENEEYIFTAGNARPLDQALQHATTELMHWLNEDYKLDFRSGSVLLGQLIRYEIGNVFDPAYTVIAKIEKRYLPT